MASTSTSTSNPLSPPPASASSSSSRRLASSQLLDYYSLSSSTTDPDPLNPDSGSHFNDELAFQKLLQTHKLAALMAKQAEVLAQIRELDGERQSLVYNHHHELVAASETIRTMKTRSSTLSPSLTSLQDSLSSLKSLSTQLNIPPGGDSSIVGQTSTPISSSSTSTDQERQRQILLKEIRPILILPQRLSDLIILRKANESSNLQIDPKTNEFGGESTIKMEEFQDPKELYLKYKDTILDWEKVGIKGAREIREDCEEVLKGC